ncbi:Lrp/AsnC family transcriptional regulator [Methanocella sp. CWC-04]|uniref:Lrp/AsnC family transcriptional regulator n=1 Tax=Methanooceanicella nereidis TaxID=2052831 RepID=A0AAP2RE82_9EURY|nr:Lrp/AsnC family transcriptional regulator [Methanocella sp. CWC-04]MCD1296056.1 Lrp/AsnC family transcriptional regulator [Methanocella sp. CWC-04]
MKIDKMNKKILNILQRNGRMTYKEVAKKIDRAQSTVRDRIGIMEEDGVIKGYTVVINKKKAGLDSYSIIQCKVDPSKLDQVTRKLLRIENVLQIYHTSGEYNLTFLIATCDYDEMKRIISDKIAPLGISEMDTLIVMESIREMAYTDIL